MKKTFKIANYDFKRLMFNPITLIGLIVIFAVTFVVGLIVQPTNTAVYKASTYGATTHQIFNEFRTNSGKEDTKNKLDKLLDQAEEYLNIQDEVYCLEYDNLVGLNTNLKNIKVQVDKYAAGLGYTITVSQIQATTDALNDFVEEYAALPEFSTKLIFTQSQFQKLQTYAHILDTAANSSSVLETVLANLDQQSDTFDDFTLLTTQLTRWTIDAKSVATFRQKYISRAISKTIDIYDEMQTIVGNCSSSDTENAAKMRSLITNYKFTCENAKKAVEAELHLLLKKHASNYTKLYNYTNFYTEDLKIELALINYHFEQDDLYFKQHQTALNFNQASYKTTAFDYTTFIISIVGLLTCAFAIFAAYKLFGRDRKSGKMDLLFAQNASFSQVFWGKFLAIVYSIFFCLGTFAVASLLWGMIRYGFVAQPILLVFNTTKAYMLSPVVMLIIKLLSFALQAIFWAVLTIFLMNISRKFELMFGIAIALFVFATLGNHFLNTQLWYCLLPFIHTDIMPFLGGATMKTGFMASSLYTHGNFYISLIYCVVVIVLLFAFTKQLFKKN